MDNPGAEVGEAAWASLPADTPGRLRALLEAIQEYEWYWRTPILRQAAAAVPEPLLAELLEHLRAAHEKDPLLVAVAGALISRGAVEAGLGLLEGTSFVDADLLDILKVLPHLSEPDRQREQMAALRRVRDAADAPWKRRDIISALIPQLPLDLLPDAAAIARDGDEPEQLIAAALRRAELRDLDGALGEVRDLGDHYHFMGLVRLAEHHPDLLRDRTVRTLIQMRPSGALGAALPPPYLGPLARAAQRLELDEASSVLETILRMLSSSGRAHAISSLGPLAPLLVTIAGQDGPHAAADAIRTVTTRWP